MGWRLKVLTILDGDLSSVSSTYMAALKDLELQIQCPLYFTRTSTHIVYMNSQRYAHIHINNTLFLSIVAIILSHTINHCS